METPLHLSVSSYGLLSYLTFLLPNIHLLVAADYSGVSHSTVWNMFLYVDLADHRMDRDNAT
jgi:hypothetical protein